MSGLGLSSDNLIVAENESIWLIYQMKLSLWCRGQKKDWSLILLQSVEYFIEMNGSALFHVQLYVKINPIFIFSCTLTMKKKNSNAMDVGKQIPLFILYAQYTSFSKNFWYNFL